MIGLLVKQRIQKGTYTNRGEELSLLLSGLSKKFKAHSVLSDIHLEVASGAFNTIFGLSGSGKSTLLKIIAGIEKPDLGKVFLGGIEVTEMPPEKRNIGFVFQKPLLFPHLSVEENIGFGLKVKGEKAEQIKNRVDELLKLLDIEIYRKRYPHEISGGQQQRVAIGRALANTPHLLLLDEPFNGLDHKLRSEMGQLIKTLQKALNLTIIFVTHDVDECLKLSDHIAILDEGRILQYGLSNDVYYYPENHRVAELMGLGNWITGTVKQGLFTTDFGTWPVSGYEEGTYKLFARPHQFTLNADEGTDFQFIHIESSGKIERITCAVKNQTIILERMRAYGIKTTWAQMKIKLCVERLRLVQNHL